MKAPSRRVFTRMSGAGNSFMICSSFPGISEPLDFEKRKVLARQLCVETEGLSADGFICLEPSQKAHFKWDFYNSDGSYAEMCGNAARCAALYYHNKVAPEKKIKFESITGIIETEILNLDDQIIQVLMPKITEQDLIKTVVLNEKSIKGFFVNTGVPHFVLQLTPDYELAKKIRSADEFKETGTNVTFVEEDEADYISAVTFERGVENFTLSCGTGAVAAAAFHKIRFPDQADVLVEMPGGVLSVNLQQERPVLVGNVEVQFDFSLYEEVI